MLPATMDGELTAKVKKALDSSQPPMGFRTLVLEDGGRSLKSDVVRSNPFPMLSCERKDCMMCCISPSKGKCAVANAVYSIERKRSPCTNDDNNCVPTYVGETSRPPQHRGAQHLALYRTDKNFMHKHMIDKHYGVMGGENGLLDYKMKVLNTFRESRNRILKAAVRIQNLDGDQRIEMLNSKIEYYAPQYVRPSYSKGPAELW